MSPELVVAVVGIFAAGFGFVAGWMARGEIEATRTVATVHDFERGRRRLARATGHDPDGGAAA